MDEGKPSATALSSAAARAAHLVADAEPRIFADTVAARLLGDRADEMIGYHRAKGEHIVLAGTRAITTVPGRFTEERLGGFGRCVVHGAGLDTFAYFESGDPVARLEAAGFDAARPALVGWLGGTRKATPTAR